MPTGKGISWDSPASETIEGAPADKPLWQYAQENGIGKTATVMGVSHASELGAQDGGNGDKPESPELSVETTSFRAYLRATGQERRYWTFMLGWDARGAA